MTHEKLDNLVKIGQLKAEPATEEEIAGLLHSGTVRLVDAKNESLSQESRFDLAYNAAHALSLAALRKAAYRSENRYLVFQCTLWQKAPCGLLFKQSQTSRFAIKKWNGNGDVANTFSQLAVHGVCIDETGLFQIDFVKPLFGEVLG